tara:strand:- start:1297 stop:2367 length:1071 start_codon:yes stop_codon:yes gene_type:complete
MVFRGIKKLKNIALFLPIIISQTFFIQTNANVVQNLANNSNSPSDENILTSSQSNNTEYILGVGDSILVKFLGLSLFDDTYTVNPEGGIYFPEIGIIKAEGKTLKELNNAIIEQYEEYIFEPEIEMIISSYRPVSFYLLGEVRQPGLYEIAKQKLPRLYDVLKMGGGFNNKADLSEIEIIRINSSSQGGGKIKTKIDLISLFDTGNQAINIRIYDGDIINIPASENSIKDQILKVNRTNVSPEMIKVFVTGNALNPGPQDLKKGTTLTQAISSSGGKKLFTGKVEFIRFNYDGSTEKKVFAYNPNAKINSRNNPILMNGDLIHIRRSLVGKTSEFLREVTNPFFSIYGFYKLIPGT